MQFNSRRGLPNLLMPGYFFGLLSLNVAGIASIYRSKFGLQKYAIEYRAG